MIGVAALFFSMNPTTHSCIIKYSHHNRIYTTTYPIKTRKTIIIQLFQDTFAAKVHILRFFFTFW